MISLSQVHQIHMISLSQVHMESNCFLGLVGTLWTKTASPKLESPPDKHFWQTYVVFNLAHPLT
jgi:hypothetical protein